MCDHQWFESASPESAGIASQYIEGFLSSVEQNKINFQGFMLLRHNKLLSYGIATPYRYTDKRHVYSVSKSFTSTAVGMAVEEGLFSLNDRVLSFFPESAPENPGENLQEMRVRDLLCMGTGHDTDTLQSLVASEDWVKTFLSLPVRFRPGTFFAYNSGASYMLSAIVQKVTGQNLMEYLTPRLFEPLHMTGIVWDKCPRNICLGGWGLHVTMEDMAKLGVLYLNNGKLGCRRILSERWVKEAVSLQISNEHMPNPDWQQGYGYQFWRCTRGCYRADGAYGQYILVSPEKDLVMVMIGETQDMQLVLNLFWTQIFDRIKDTPLEPNPAENALLKIKTASLSCNQIEWFPAIQRPYHQMFDIESNPYGLTRLALNVQNNSCYITLQCSDGRSFEAACEKNRWTYIKEKNFPVAPVSGVFDLYKNSDATVAVAYYWEDVNTLIVKVQFVDSPHFITFRYHLSSEGNEVYLIKSTSATPSEAQKAWKLIAF